MNGDMRIAALDFETANSAAPSICSAGLAVFADGRLTETHHWLVHPPKGFGYFRKDFVQCHGIDWFDVRDAPEFSDIAGDLMKVMLAADIVVAHNAPFDIGKLRGAMEHFGLSVPAFSYLCTLQLSRRIWPELENHQLPTVASHIGHAFQHHHALTDAEAAGRIFLALLSATRTATPQELAAAAGVETGTV